MAIQAQTLIDPHISFAAADWDGHSLAFAVQGFVIDEHTQELGNVIGAFRSDGWIWLRPKDFDRATSFNEFSTRAREIYGHTCTPIYDDGSFLARPGQAEEIIRQGIGSYRCDRISNSLLLDEPQDLLRILHHLSRFAAVFLVNNRITTHGGIDLVWPVGLTVDVLSHSISFWAEWAEKTPSFDAVKKVAENLVETWNRLFESILSGDLALVGASVGMGPHRPARLTLTNKHLIDIWTGDVITRACGFDRIIREKHWSETMLTRREPLSVIGIGVGAQRASQIG